MIARSLVCACGIFMLRQLRSPKGIECLGLKVATTLDIIIHSDYDPQILVTGTLSVVTDDHMYVMMLKDHHRKCGEVKK